MKKVIVSILSDQNMPNMQFIKEFRNVDSSYIFIESEDMQKKGKLESIVSALQLPLNSITIIKVDPYKIPLIENALLEADFDDVREYFVNITGGTKPMSLAAYSFFTSFKNAKIFYVPIEGEMYRQVFPRIEIAERDFNNKISLKEYLKSYKLQLSSLNRKLSRPFSQADKIMTSIFDSNGNIESILNSKNAHQLNNTEDRRYFSGGWFEEYIFWIIKSELNIRDSMIANGVKIQNEKSKNEFDVVFLYKNVLHLIECKAYYSESNIKANIEKSLYKLGALDEDFGLKVKAHFITTFDMINYNPRENYTLQERANTLGINFFQLRDLRNNEFINNIK